MRLSSPVHWKRARTGTASRRCPAFSPDAPSCWLASVCSPARKTSCSAISGGTARRSSCTSIPHWQETDRGIGHVPNRRTGSRTGRPIPCWPALPPARSRKSTISRATTCIPNWTPCAAISSSWNGKTASPQPSRPEARRSSFPCFPNRKSAPSPPFPKLRPAGMPTTRIR